jgi:hypothetical protein
MARCQGNVAARVVVAAAVVVVVVVSSASVLKNEDCLLQAQIVYCQTITGQVERF